MYKFYIIGYIANFVGSLELVYLFNKTMPAKNEKYSKLYTILAIILYTTISPVMYLENILREHILLITLVYHILVMIYPLLTRKTTFGEALFLSSFYISVISLMISSLYILLLIFDIDLVSTYLYIYNSSEEAIYNLLFRIIRVVIIVIFANNMHFIKGIDNRMLYSMSAAFIINHILMRASIHFLDNNISKYGLDLILIIIGLLLIEIISIYILIVFSREMKEKFMLKINLKKRKHEQEIIEMYKEMRGWKHDFRNHINIILGLLENDSKMEAIQYIEDIDIRTSKFERHIYTENITIDSILSSKVKIAEENNIKFDIKINITSEIKLPNIDMCIILGNLIDNSIEACKKIHGYKLIDLEMNSDQNRLIIRIKNNTNGEVNKINGKFFTTKREGLHGIGLLQIDDIVEKYDGYINRKHEDNVFYTSIMIQY